MKIFLAYIVLFISVACRVQATDLTIWVKDIKDQHNIQGAAVKFESGRVAQIVTTGVDGKAVLQNIAFPLNISCAVLGYEKIKTRIRAQDVLSEGNTLTYTLFAEKTNGILPEIVITGQNTPVLATQSIYKVNTISATQISQRAAISLNDVLNYEMNNFISNDNLLGSSVSIGGIGGQNVKILMNGIPVMGRENGNIDLGQLNMTNIKRIEMIQGPMSVMYGSNALGGVINLITQQSPKKWSAGIRSYMENIGRYNFGGNISYSHNRHQLQFSTSRNFFQGWTPKDSLDRYQLWKPKTQYLGDLQYNYTYKKLKLNYFSSYLYEKITNKGVPIVNPYEGYAFDEYYRTQRNIQSVGTEVQLNEKEKLSFVNSYSIYHRTKNRFKKDLVSLEQAETKSVGDQDTTRFNNINLRGTLTSQRIKNTDLLAGYEYTYELGRSFKLAEERQTMADLGVFASALYRYKKFNIQPSFRITYNSRFQTAFTPALHAKYDISSNTQLRASYARGFRTPTLKELYLQFIDQNHTIIGNPDLKPEIGDHYEAGIEHQLKLERSTLTIHVNGIHNEIRNLISLAVFNQHGVLRKYSNIDEYNNWMVNTQIKWRGRNLNLSGGGGLIYVEASKVIPQHNIFELSGQLAYNFIKYKAGINFNYKYNSRQPVITVDNQFLYTDPIHIANASLQKSLFKNTLQCQVGVKNIFNIQNTALNGAGATTGGGHTSTNGMQVFPARSIFVDLGFNF